MNADTDLSRRAVVSLRREIDELWSAYGDARTDAGAEAIRDEIRERERALDAAEAMQDALTLTPRHAN